MSTLHNVYFVKYDVKVSFMAQVLDTVTYFVSHVLIVDTVTCFDIFLVVDTVAYFRGNHGSRV